jgi:ELWxxDGT repeat protein
VKANRRLLLESLEDRRLLAVVARVVEDSLALGGINNGDVGSDPSNVVEIGGGVGFFVANDGLNGVELWRVSGGGNAVMVEDSLAGGGLAPGLQSSSPTSLTNINGTLYFAANDGTNGIELWRVNSGGVAEMVEDAVAGSGIGDGSDSSFPVELTNVAGTLFFVASDGFTGRELWRINSSGTAELVEGPGMAGGIRPGIVGSIPRSLTAVGSQVFFEANDGVNGYELWRASSTGTASMVEGSVPGGGIAAGNESSYPSNLKNFSGTLYFAAYDLDAGVEVWRVSGSGNAELVEDTLGGGDGIASSSAGSYPSYFTNSNGTLFFRALTPTLGDELWRINGSGQAVVVEDAIPGGGIAPGTASSYPSSLIDNAGTLYFRADTADQGSELWRVNGSGVAEIVSRAGTTGIRTGADGSSPAYATSVSGTLFFSANDGTNGIELWRVTNGGLATLVEDTLAGGGLAPGSADSLPSTLTNFNGQLFFVASNTAVGQELWRVDGTGTAVIVEDNTLNGGIQANAGSSSPRFPSIVGSSLYFAADDGLHGVELWRLGASNQASIVQVDGTMRGINTNSADSQPRNLALLNGTLYFSAFDGGNGRELWRINSSGVAELVEDGIPGGGLRPDSASSNPRDLVTANGTVYFTADTDNGTGLWRIDSNGNAVLITEKLNTGGVDVGIDQPRSAALTNVGGTLYFVAADATSGNELWRVNGAGQAELVLVAATTGGINPNAGSSNPNSLISVNGTLFFIATNPAAGEELWTVNGTGNAVLVEDGVPGGGIYPDVGGSSPNQLFNHLGTLYFQANDGANGRELWRVTGAATASMVEDAIPGGGISAAFSSYPAEFATVGSTLYFQADDGVNGLELWRIVGTNPAELVEDALPGGGINPGIFRSNPRELTNVSGTLYFNGNNAINGYELWRVGSSGVAELVEDSLSGGGIRPGSDSSAPAQLTNAGGTLFFQANDGSNGVELWRVVGSGPAEMVEDAAAGGGLSPGDSPSYPSSILSISGTVYFVADTTGSGAELWSIDVGGMASRMRGPTLGLEILPGENSSDPTSLTNVNGQLYFAADGGNSFGIELMRIANNNPPSITRNLANVVGDVLTPITNTGTWSDLDNDSVVLSANIGSVIKNGDGTWSWSHSSSVAAANQVVQITATDGLGDSASVTFNIRINSVVQDRRIFYNRSISSVFGNGSGNPINAIDPTKVALRPGQVTSFANYTNYVRGLNGIIVDVAGLAGTVTASDFLFAVGDGTNPTAFAATTAVPTISVFAGGGLGGADRIKVEFADIAIRNTWLRVTVRATAATGLAADDVFYFGSAVGDTNVGNIGDPISIRTNASDTSSVRQNQSVAANSVGISNIFDLNKDGRVNASDTSVTRQNISPAIMRYFTAPTNLQLSILADESSAFDSELLNSIDEYFTKLS